MRISEPRTLVLETSGRVGQIALGLGEQVHHVRRLDEARRHGRDLVPAVAELLSAKGWQPREIQLVMVSRGPGSYTGLRVGIMSAKTFAYVTGCALIAVDTFAAIASQAPPEAMRVEVLADAQQGKVYVQGFARQAAKTWVPTSALRIQKLTDWLVGRDAEAWMTGPGCRAYAGKLPEGLLTVAASAWDPQPESLLRIGLARYRAGQRDDPWALEPLYLRPSSAEEKWQQRSCPSGP